MLTKKETENSSNFKFTCISNILFKFILANLLKYLVTFVFLVLINYMYKLFLYIKFLQSLVIMNKLQIA